MIKFDEFKVISSLWYYAGIKDDYVMLAVIMLVLVKLSDCSVVIDSSSQNGANINDYCTIPYCKEGTHVMCMYYNPRSVMGPKCYNAKNVSVTPVIATKILDIANAIRSKIALGKEKGRKGVYLPRGYGLFILEWDNELATFAQVLANQCTLQHDLCRASEKFPDPGQVSGLVRFTYPEWIPISKSNHLTSPGLSEQKLLYSVIQTLKFWYNQKNTMTPDNIINFPDWSLNPNEPTGKPFLKMLYGSATHIGCGISAYTEFAYYDNNADLNYNSIQIICNLSERPHKGGSVYNTTKPIAPGYTIRCGCPPGSDEGEDCLCRKNPDTPPLTEKPKEKVCSENDVDCKDPTVVVLPIFTFEDAPQHKLIKPEKQNFATENKSNQFFKKRTSSKNSIFQNDELSKMASLRRYNKRKSSIFTNERQFQLPTQNANLYTNNLEHLSKENDIYSLRESPTKEIQLTDDSHNIVSLHDIKTSDTLPRARKIILNSEEDRIMTNENYWKTNKINAESGNVDKVEKTNNLLYLLDKLENEVRNIELKENEKVFIDAKIRKIYDSAVGRNNLLLSRNPKRNYRSKVKSRIDIKRNNEDNDLDYDTDYYLDDDDIYQTKKLRASDKPPRDELDNINNEDSFRQCTKRNHRLYCLNKYNTEDFDRYEDRPSSNNLGMANNKFRDAFEENDRYFIRGDYYEDRLRNYRKTNTLNRNRYRKENLEYNYKTSNDVIDMKRSRQLHNVDSDIKPRKIYKTFNSRTLSGHGDYMRRNRYRNIDIADDDPLGPERRRYYQDKLDKLQRQIQKRQHYAHIKRGGSRPMRPMRPPMDTFKSRSRSPDLPYMSEPKGYLRGFY